MRPTNYVEAVGMMDVAPQIVIVTKLVKVRSWMVIGPHAYQDHFLRRLRIQSDTTAWTPGVGNIFDILMLYGDHPTGLTAGK